VGTDTATETTERRTRRAVLALVDAAVALDDRDPARALTTLGELLDGTTPVEALGTASMLTLRGLARHGGTGTAATRPVRGHGVADPRELIDRAVGYGIAPRPAVLAAAWRLDAVRRGDHDRAAAEIATSSHAGSPGELVAGAASLLASALSLGTGPTGIRSVASR
jgi:hypothetical protein